MQDFSSWLKRAWDWVSKPINAVAVALSLVPMYFASLYMDTYGRNVPINDQWFFSFPIAIAARNKTLSLDLILQDFAGHRIFFTGLWTALVSAATDWNLRTEMWLNLPLAVGEFLVLVAIFRRQAPQLTALVLVPFSLITFSLYQYLNWVCGFYSIWHFVPLFLLLMIWTIQRFQPGWLPVLLGGFFAFCATWSLGPGVVTWPALFIALWLFGYRKPWYYLALGVVLVGTLYLYTREVQVSVAGGETGGFSSLKLDNPIGTADFILSYLGAPFSTVFDEVQAERMGVAGLIAVAINLAALFYRERNLRSLAPWLTMVLYAGGVATLTALTRFDADVPTRALEQRYVTTSAQLWLALIALMVINGAASATWERYGRLLLVGNVLFGAVLAGLYFENNIWNLQATAKRYSHTLDAEYDLFSFEYTALNEEQCIRNYPKRREDACIRQFATQIGPATPEQIYMLAAYELSVFSDAEKLYVFPDGAYGGAPILLNSPSRWLNVYIRDYLLNNVSRDAMLHLIHPQDFEDAYSTDDLPEPLENVTEGIEAETIVDFVGDSDQIWLITVPELVDDEIAINAILQEAGYTPLFTPITTRGFQDSAFRMFRYRKAPENASDLFVFDENIRLQAFEVTGDAQPCEALTVTSWWKIRETPPRNYSASLMLVNEAGEKITNVDAGLAGIDLGVWVPDLFYPDTRTITLPCDLPPGNYELELMLYDFETFESLPVTDGEGESARAVVEKFLVSGE
jgi:hypothetical protein